MHSRYTTYYQHQSIVCCAPGPSRACQNLRHQPVKEVQSWCRPEDGASSHKHTHTHTKSKSHVTVKTNVYCNSLSNFCFGDAASIASDVHFGIIKGKLLIFLPGSPEITGCQVAFQRAVVRFAAPIIWWAHNIEQRWWCKRIQKCVAVRGHGCFAIIVPVCSQTIAKLCFTRENSTSRSNTDGIPEMKVLLSVITLASEASVAGNFLIASQVSRILNFWTRLEFQMLSGLQLSQIKGASGSIKLSSQDRHYRELSAKWNQHHWLMDDGEGL